MTLKDFKKGFIDNNILKPTETLKKELASLKKTECGKILFKNINYKTVTEEIQSQSFRPKSSNSINSDYLDMTGYR